MRRTGVIYLATGDALQHELLQVSRSYLLKHHPELDQCVISDRPTVDEANGDGDDSCAGTANVLTLAGESARGPASRAYKTRLHQFSPFEYSLFVDNDIIVTKRIDSIWQGLDRNPLAVAVDIHSRVGQAIEESVRDKLISPDEAGATEELCGRDGLFFNTGVLVWKRCRHTDQFFSCWHEEWRRFQGRDQFAFIRALARTGLTISILPRAFNVPVVPNVPREELDNAKILHFWSPPKMENIRRLGFLPTESSNSSASPAMASGLPLGTHSRRPRVCIVCSNQKNYSETFVRAHVERLPAEVSVFSGVWYPAPPDLPAKLTRFLIECRAQAVLAEFGPVGVAIMEVCRRLRLPLTVHFHGMDAHHHGVVQPLHEHYRRLFDAADAVVAVSKTMVARLQELGAPSHKVHYNPYGVDASRFVGADPAAAPPRFIAVGRFVDKKAPQLTLLAFRDVFQQCPEATLDMIGDGPLLESCKELVRAFALTDAVQFLGVREHAEVASAMKQARAFVQHSMRTSYGDCEGTPVAILEAGAAGLPVIATRHAGIQDAVLDGETGFLTAEGDVTDMAARMIQMARDPQLAAKLGRNASQHITSEFSMDKSIGGLWNIVRSTLPDLGRGSATDLPRAQAQMPVALPDQLPDIVHARQAISLPQTDLDVGGYGISEIVRPHVLKPMGPEVTYSDLLVWLQHRCSEPVYLEIGTSIGKNIFLALNLFRPPCHCIGVDLEDVHPQLQNVLAKQGANEYRLGPNRYSHVQGSVFDESTWKAVRAAVGHRRVSIVYSDACHSYDGLMREFTFLQHLIDWESPFALLYDDLFVDGLQRPYYPEMSFAFGQISTMVTSRFCQQARIRLLRLRGWCGVHLGKHTMGLVTNIDNLPI